MRLKQKKLNRIYHWHRAMCHETFNLRPLLRIRHAAIAVHKKETQYGSSISFSRHCFVNEVFEDVPAQTKQIILQPVYQGHGALQLVRTGFTPE